VILVVGLRVGCINHALLTVSAIQREGIALAGWVANQIDPEMTRVEENVATIQNKIAAPLLGQWPYQQGEPLAVFPPAALRLPDR